MKKHESLLTRESFKLSNELERAVEEGKYSVMAAIEESLNRVQYLTEYEKLTGNFVSKKELKKLLNPYEKWDEKYSVV
jgi:hypothetical protein